MSAIVINGSESGSERDLEENEEELNIRQQPKWSCLTLLIGVLISIIPIAMIVIASMYFDGQKYCPIEKSLSTHLLIGGISFFLRSIFLMIVPIFPNKRCLKYVSILLDILSLIWFIILCVYVYKISGTVKHDYDASHDHPYYCDEVFYTFVFWVVTATVIMVTTAVIVSGIAIVTQRCYLYYRPHIMPQPLEEESD